MRPELQEIVNEASRVLRADTTLEDRDFNLVAFGTQRSEVDTVRRNSILQRTSTRPIRDWFEQFGISTSSSPLRTPADPDGGVRARLCLPCRWRGVTYGYLWVLDESTPVEDPAVVRVAELAEHAASFLAQLSRQVNDAAYDVADLISPDVEKMHQAASRVHEAGWQEPGTPVVAVVVAAICAPLPAPLAPNLALLPRTVLAEASPHGANLLVPVRPGSDHSPLGETVALALDLYRQELPEGWSGHVVAGIGDPRSDLVQLRASWLEARVAVQVAGAVALLRPVARWSELGLYRLLASVARGELAALVLDPPVRLLMDSPDPDLVHTVRTYLDLAANVQDTAAALHIHRQTLYYRLNKAETLTGLSFSSGLDRTRLHLALLLAPLVPRPDGAPAFPGQ